jgi:alkanesulfonate monooxygenase SsuD/methylene tetrahydromethanopterin reductase-like flavin-dependent oxidoreductase (luciferase family)
MRFGLFWQTPGSAESSVARRHWETIEEIVLGEQLGFETAWLAESVFYPTRPMSNPLMVAIAAAQCTERIRFGTLAAQAPLHHPFHMATQSATCDILTQGRLDLCLGGRWGSRFGRFFGHGEISSEESRERVAETIELIKLAGRTSTSRQCRCDSCASGVLTKSQRCNPANGALGTASGSTLTFLSLV